jgi:hypothetical protein
LIYEAIPSNEVETGRTKGNIPPRIWTAMINKARAIGANHYARAKGFNCYSGENESHAVLPEGIVFPC